MNKRADRIAIVTGASSGIGQATAVALFAEGWHVVFAGRRLDRLEQAIVAATQARRAQAGEAAALPRALAVQTDVTSEDSVRNLFARTYATFGRLDLLFNNAGISGQEVPVEDLSIDVWRSVVDTNLTGMFLCIQEAVRLMKHQTPRGGRIINNGSISAQVPRRNSIAYTATKHAVTGLTKSIALDCRDFDIACGQIDVGRIDSEIGASSPTATANPSSIPKLDTQLAAQAVLQMANLPIEANMLFTTLLPTKMPFVGRG
ncbi:SDR family oxidoreductase [Peristeroidobacter soli]|jgi:NAD(P)-dependent dehydrogenase (short-subunit alcohol dehydrogenase family)|uniref:SDR family oxidoreductase n=1 Tax=Peristeroidobacter soli TaxID=2497877 RepID=UPI00101C6C3F|nr:SDR family oxidoreductase [Peristeroidobacter soli]